MKTLLIGSGGREHALALKLSQADSIEKVFAAPGNPGMKNCAEIVDLDAADFDAVAEFCKKNSVDFAVVGPEKPLAEGLADFLRDAGIDVFGPSREAARLEASKAFAKEFMNRRGIPTAEYRVFTDDLVVQATNYVRKIGAPCAIKASGLAAGKGVIIPKSADEGERAIHDMFAGKFGDAGKTIVIEKFLRGEEASILAVTDGENYATLASAQDHKRIFDGDKGPNTGGMGAYAPAPIVTEEILEKIKSRIIEPAIRGMKAEGYPFVGCLYAGLMIDPNGDPYVVEFNVRFGDPETQPVLSVFRGDFGKLLSTAAKGSLDKSAIENVAEESACCVVLASEGYPGAYEKGAEISGIEVAETGGAIVYHAGTAEKDGKLVTAGGRVLGVTGIGKDLKSSIDAAYSAVDKIEFAGKYFRKDIGAKGLER